MATLTHSSTATTNKTVVGFVILGGVAIAAMVGIAASVQREVKPRAQDRPQTVPIVEEQKTISTEDY